MLHAKKRALAGNIANIILGSNTFEKMRGRSFLFSFYFFISVWISMLPNNPIKMWSLNHYRLGRMLINNSCSWVSYFDKYRTDKKHRTRELSAFVTAQTIQEERRYLKKKLLSSYCKAVSCQQIVNIVLLNTYIGNSHNVSRFCAQASSTAIVASIKSQQQGSVSQWSDSGRIERQSLRLVEVEGREVWKKLKPPDIFHGDLSDSLPPLLFSYKATLGPNSTQTWSYLTFRSSQYYNIFCQSEPSWEYLRNNKEQCCSRRSATTIKKEANTMAI